MQQLKPPARPRLPRMAQAGQRREKKGGRHDLRSEGDVEEELAALGLRVKQ